MTASLRVGIVTLGCDKNTVDNEYLAGLLEQAGCSVVPIEAVETLPPLDAAVVTTCGFIRSATEQSLDTLLELADAKRRSKGAFRLFVAGCLSQRYAGDLLDEIPEIDGIAGVGQFQQLADMILKFPAGSASGRCIVSASPVPASDFPLPRTRLDQKPYAFLKIADGCNHACTFCAIPIMKGKLKSLPKETLLAEARALLASGVKELNLIAQDLTQFGMDREDQYRLPNLLEDLCALEGDFWIRCLYCYPGGITADFLAVVARQPKVVPYLDIPFQHLDPGILKRMRRPAHDLHATELVRRLREIIDGLAIRSTMMVGFPGETSSSFERLIEGIQAIQFNWLGVFKYSAEEGTRAAEYQRQVSPGVMEKRWHTVMETQADISSKLNLARVGSRARVLVESYDPILHRWIARSSCEAPDVDGRVLLHSSTPLPVGTFQEVRITGSDVYDLDATIDNT